MSALNISRALPSAVTSDVSAGKVQEMGGDEGGNGFADVFRDLGRASRDGGDSLSSAKSDKAGEEQAGRNGKAADQNAKPDKAFSLADALATAASKRSGETAPSNASISSTADGATTAQASTLLAMFDGATPGQDGADAPSSDVATPKDDQGKGKSQTEMERAARGRRLANDGLNRLLFGSKDGINGLSPATKPAVLSDDEIRSANADQPLLISEGDDTQGATDANASATPALSDPAAVVLQGLAQLTDMVPRTTEDGQTDGRDAAPTAVVAPNTGDQDGGTGQGRTLSVSVLSRETHFAPIRTLAMNGGSAPTDAAATSAAAAPLGADTTVTKPETRAAAGLRGLRPERLAVQDTPGAAPLSGKTVIADAGEDATTTGSTQATVADAARTGTRQDSRSGNSGKDDRNQPDTQRLTETTAEAARSDVKQGQTSNVSEAAHGTAETAPLTGTAGIAPTNAIATPNLPALQQIGAAIAAEATSMDQGAGIASADSSTAQVLAGPVRILQIQLKPDELGTVNVRMRLSGGTLEIQLRASNPETARMLERDRDALTDLLKASGISADTISIVGIDGGTSQITGRDAGRPFEGDGAQTQPEARDSRDGLDQDNRGSGNDDSQKGGRDDEARNRSRSADAGFDFRV
ncbi:flagellar hook-length control protein FliK [Azorhizobium caulinodans]|uniref:flagellar hook-length control protein FliK n=1 Tax=Azorhizobium caulinodans TaxID=7 RepID=UPI002FBDA272